MSQPKDKPTVDVESVGEAVKNSTTEKPKKVKKTQWGLAVILIGIGIILILDSFSIMEFKFNFWALLKLWPLILVSAGLGVLSERNKTLKTIATVGNVILTVFAGSVVTGIVPFSSEPAKTENETIVVNESVKKADLDLKLSGKLTISAHEETEAVRYRGNDLETKRENKDDREEIKIEPKSALAFTDLNTEISLSKKLPIELDIDFGAGSIDADLRGLDITRLDIDSGVSDLSIKLDSTAERHIYLDFDLGVSNAVLYVPKTVGVRLSGESGLSNVSTTGLESRGNNIYETANLSTFDTVYEINLDSGMTNFELKYL